MAVELPPLAELKSQIAEQKALAKSVGKKKYIIVYCFGNGLVVDAERLLVTIKATDAVILQTKESRNKQGFIVSQCFIEGNGATFLLLPRLAKENHLTNRGCFVLM